MTATERIGVLLVNTGTPATATPRDVRRFLRKFLSDPRVIELPRALWLPILYGVVLTLRPPRSARKYRRIWTPEGSPLAVRSEALRAALAGTLAQRALAPMSVELAMLYSEPSVRDSLRRLRESGLKRLVVLPLFPQYSGTTTGAVYDQVTAELSTWRSLPEVRFIADYHDHPGYIDALRASVLQHQQQYARTRRLLMSFHGIPAEYTKRGDPYFARCQRTARLLADELMLADDAWQVSFQSRLGRARWLEPYTSVVLENLPRAGIDSVTVICPGFAVDCLETLEEIEIENRAVFLDAGGQTYHYVPALNESPTHARFLADLVAEHVPALRPATYSLRPTA